MFALFKRSTVLCMLHVEVYLIFTSLCWNSWFLSLFQDEKADMKLSSVHKATGDLI